MTLGVPTALQAAAAMLVGRSRRRLSRRRRRGSHRRPRCVLTTRRRHAVVEARSVPGGCRVVATARRHGPHCAISPGCRSPEPTVAAPQRALPSPSRLTPQRRIQRRAAALALVARRIVMRPGAVRAAGWRPSSSASRRPPRCRERLGCTTAAALSGRPTCRVDAVPGAPPRSSSPSRWWQRAQESRRVGGSRPPSGACAEPLARRCAGAREHRACQ